MSSGTDEYWKMRRKETEARHMLNMRIVDTIKKFLDDNPDQRFNQAMVNLGLGDCKDGYGLEPDLTLHIVEMNLKDLKEKG